MTDTGGDRPARGILDTPTVIALRDITTARAYDALIAATALAHQLPVYTCHPADFDKIDGLQVVPVRLPGPASG